MFDDSAESYNRALRILYSGKGDDSPDVWIGIYGIHWGLYQIMLKFGRKEEALDHIRQSMEIRENFVGDASRDVAFGNLELAELYASVSRYHEALPWCLKALDLHVKLGSDVHVVALVRGPLGFIYAGLEEHTKVYVQHELAREVLLWDDSYDSLVAKVDVAKLLIAERRRYEAMGILEYVFNGDHFQGANADLRLLIKFGETRELWRSCKAEERKGDLPLLITYLPFVEKFSFLLLR